ncbi:hypothetical protein FRC07_007508 [Ceratobasidium sp. 392]|nr:hypothetical protein FRC07_007508 [Ceratobasidium sp. 392]
MNATQTTDDEDYTGDEAQRFAIRDAKRSLLIEMQTTLPKVVLSKPNGETFGLEELQEMLRVTESMEILLPDSAEDTAQWGKVKQKIVAAILFQVFERYEESRNDEDLKLMIGYSYGALQLESGENLTPERQAIVGFLSLKRFRNQGSLEDLTRGIHCFGRAIELAPDCHPWKSVYLTKLSTLYMLRYKHTHRLEDQEISANFLEQAVSMLSDDHPEKPERLDLLMSLHASMFHQTGRVEHLDKMMICGRQALALTPEGHRDKPQRLASLGNLYLRVFLCLGRLHDLDQSAYYAEQAVLLAPDSHHGKSWQLGELGTLYLVMFRCLGRTEDHEKAIGYYEEATHMTSGDNRIDFTLLLNLSSLYTLRYQRTEVLDDLKKAVDYQERAMTLIPSDLQDDNLLLVLLGTLCHFLSLARGSSQDFDNAVDYLNQAALLTPDNQMNKPSCLGILGEAYLARFRQFGRLEDINQSLEHLNKAALLPSDYDPALTVYLSKLGRAHELKFQSSGLLQDLQASMAYYQRAAALPTGRPRDKLESAWQWARQALCLSDHPLGGYTHAMTLLPHVVWLGSSIQHRYESISKAIGDLVTEAAAMAVTRNRNDLALEWLEQGRSIVWSQMLHLRTPLDDLHAAYPKVAEELQLVCTHLERASMPDSFSLMHASHQLSQLEVDCAHRRAAERREWLVESIRQLPGFEDFLRPSSSSKLVGMLQGRVAVIINVHNNYSGALVVQSDTKTITHVRLPDFSEQMAENARSHLTSCLQKEGVRRGFKVGTNKEKTTYVGILSMLWYDVVQPVLAHLDIAKTLPADSDALPHITWCTTGALSSLPIHAAGDYSDPSTVLPNLAISSYSPTLAALGRSISASSTFSGILAVGHASSVRGLSALPGTKAELDEVQVLARGQLFTRLDEDKACADAVLQAMESHSWVHFACHGSQNPYDPLKSALHLHDKELDLATIAQHPLKNKQLAILSACQTAKGDSALPDESLHLAAGLLMAGYPTVIATMWSVHDQDAPLITKKVYECLLEGGVPDSRKAAKALHRAVASLRATVGVEQYGRWMPYVHIGC